MKLTDEQKLRTYRSIALQIEKARIDKGWTLEEAATETKRNTLHLRKLEFGLDSHRMHIGDLMRIAADYDKLVRIELVDPPQPHAKEIP